MRKLFIILLVIAISIPVLAKRDETEPTQGEISSELAKLKSSMVTVEGGRFLMGEAAEDTTVGSFCISKYEVTQGLWRAVMGKLGYYNSKRDDNLPIETRHSASVGIR